MANTTTDPVEPELGTPAKSGTPPSINAVQSDVALANNYRIELVKTVLALATGLFAFTVSFPVARSATDIVWGWLGWVSWVALAVSMVAGLIHMRLWEAFYISYRDQDWKQQKRGAGKAVRDNLTWWRRGVMWAQYGSFVIAVLAVGLLAAINTKYG